MTKIMKRDDGAFGFGPYYPALERCAPFRRLAAQAGGVAKMARVDVEAYAQTIFDEIGRMNRNEGGLRPQRGCRCASGSPSNNGHAILRRISELIERDNLRALAAEHKRKLHDGWYNSEYAKALTEKRARREAEETEGLVFALPASRKAPATGAAVRD